MTRSQCPSETREDLVYPPMVSEIEGSAPSHPHLSRLSHLLLSRIDPRPDGEEQERVRSHRKHGEGLQDPPGAPLPPPTIPKQGDRAAYRPPLLSHGLAAPRRAAPCCSVLTL